ncbi:hypothetical protein KUCAC02_022305, partial [Chaenocephalus aceratus]
EREVTLTPYLPPHLPYYHTHVRLHCSSSESVSFQRGDELTAAANPEEVSCHPFLSWVSGRWSWWWSNGGTRGGRVGLELLPGQTVAAGGQEPAGGGCIDLFPAPVV